MQQRPKSRSELPFSLGGLEGTAKKGFSAKLRVPLPWRNLIVSLLGVLLAITGAVVALSPLKIDAYMEASGKTVVIGNGTLQEVQPSQGETVYQGAGVLVIKTVPGGLDAGGSASSNGVPVTGNCQLRTIAYSPVEYCQFTAGNRSFTSTDSANGDGFVRRYSDGVTVTLAIPKGSSRVPIPFPLGETG